MTPEKLNRFWLLATFLLILVIIISSIVISLKVDPGQTIEISPPPTADFQGQIYIEGAIANPGVYPLKSGDNLAGLIQASGGISNDADLSRMQLYIPPVDEEAYQSQKIDINHADNWLLQALPGIGEVRAQAIIDYRLRNGDFLSIEELTQVPGITDSVFVKIKDLVTIGERE